ncbi:hypothetical protein FRC00_009140, partial [Tulasnella sp. 408]
MPIDEELQSSPTIDAIIKMNQILNIESQSVELTAMSPPPSEQVASPDLGSLPSSPEFDLKASGLADGSRRSWVLMQAVRTLVSAARSAAVAPQLADLQISVPEPGLPVPPLSAASESSFASSVEEPRTPLCPPLVVVTSPSVGVLLKQMGPSTESIIDEAGDQAVFVLQPDSDSDYGGSDEESGSEYDYDEPFDLENDARSECGGERESQGSTRQLGSTKASSPSVIFPSSSSSSAAGSGTRIPALRRNKLKSPVIDFTEGGKHTVQVVHRPKRNPSLRIGHYPHFNSTVVRRHRAVSHIPRYRRHRRVSKEVGYAESMRLRSTGKLRAVQAPGSSPDLGAMTEGEDDLLLNQTFPGRRTMACVSNHVLRFTSKATSATSARDLASMVQVTPAPGQDNGKFELEARVWRILRHPHILEFIGIYRKEGHMYLVSPFIENGTLMEYIAANPDADRPRFLSETADALAYLHAMQITHADVKGSNILVSADLRALICDFGLAKWMPSITASQSKGAGTMRWQSPELWYHAPRCFASDVYAFGITIAEVLSGSVPFSEFLMDEAVMRAVLVDDARPRPDPTHSPTGESYQRIWKIATRCWRREPTARPTMKQVFDSFRTTAASTEDSGDETPDSSDLDEGQADPPPPYPTEDTNWVTFIPGPAGRQIGKFQPAKATNQAYGAFSDVKMCEVIYENGRRDIAALKRLRPVRLGTQAENTSDIDRERFEREILVWAGIWHPNVAPLLGFTLSPAFYLISPWYPNGTIRQYISTHPSCDRLYLIQDVAAGLAYLHTCQPPIVHGDIKSNNVVVDADGHAKIIDFGLSQILENSTTEANTVIEVGNSRWMAPE